MTAAAPVHVVAGVVCDPRGRVLLAQRLPGRHLAGCWEFPGGKSDPGEAPVDALARELREELGIVIESARPLIRVPHDYAEKRIVLDVWRVQSWSGMPEPREGQRLAWAELDTLDRVPMPDADRPAITALRLPSRYLITPAVAPTQVDELIAGIERACARGVDLILLRQPQWPLVALADAARRALHACHAQRAQLLLHGDPRLATILGCDGVHLPARLAAQCVQRPLPKDRWLGVSCHDADELAQAVRIGADFATLSPVFETPTHPEAVTLGWERFEELVASVPLPVYALGGLEADDMDAAQMAGAQGIAAVRAWWGG